MHEKEAKIESVCVGVGGGGGGKTDIPLNFYIIFFHLSEILLLYLLTQIRFLIGG